MTEPQDLERPFFEDVEVLFSEFVEFYGGKVIDKLDGNLVDRLNADYLFEKHNTIAELKTFKKDVFSEAEDFPRFENLMTKWVSKKMITHKEFRDFTFKRKQLPKKCIDDLISVGSKTIERAIQKGNKQIQESKKTFDKPNADGILFLINDGNYFFTTEGFLNIISSLIGRKFKDASFNVIVYITVNQVTRKPGSDLDYNVWIPTYTKVNENGETIVTDEFHKFINDLGEKFQVNFLTHKTGHKPIEHNKIEDLLDTVDELKNHRFIPKDIIYKK